MIRFLDFLTPFINEIFKARQSQRRTQGLYKRVFGYSIIALSILGNYFLSKKIYTLSITNYHYAEKIKEMQGLPLLLDACEEKNEILADLIDDAIDKVRPVKRQANTRIDHYVINGKEVTVSESKDKNDHDSSEQSKDKQTSSNSKKNSTDKSNSNNGKVKNNITYPGSLSTIEQRREATIEARHKYEIAKENARKSRERQLNGTDEVIP